MTHCSKVSATHSFYLNHIHDQFRTSTKLIAYLWEEAGVSKNTTQAQGEHENPTQRGPSRGSNQ